LLLRNRFKIHEFLPSERSAARLRNALKVYQFLISIFFPFGLGSA